MDWKKCTTYGIIGQGGSGLTGKLLWKNERKVVQYSEVRPNIKGKVMFVNGMFYVLRENSLVLWIVPNGGDKEEIDREQANFP